MDPLARDVMEGRVGRLDLGQDTLARDFAFARPHDESGAGGRNKKKRGWTKFCDSWLAEVDIIAPGRPLFALQCSGQMAASILA